MISGHVRILTAGCSICPCMTSDHCGLMGIVYRVTCLWCLLFYVGETERPGHDRFSEHLRYAASPNNTSYKDEAFAIHYRLHHPNIKPKLQFQLIEKGLPNTVRRKIAEAYYIVNLKPAINNRNECDSIARFLVK